MSCEVCGSAFSEYTCFKKHVKTHTGKETFPCQVCCKHTGEKPFSCNVCESAFSSLSYLKDHVLRYTGEKPFSCEVCLSAFSKPDHLKRHL